MTERAFEAEQEQIETDFANERAQLKESLLAELLNRRAALLEERERLAQGDANGNGVEEDDSIIPSAGLMEQPQSQAGAARQSSRQKVKAATGATGKPGDLLVIPSATTTTKRRTQQSATSVLGISTMLPDWEIYEDLNAISRAAGDEAGGLGGGAGGRRNAPRNPKNQAPPQASSQPAATSSKKRPNASDSAAASPLPKQSRTAPSTSAEAAVSEKPSTTAHHNNIYIEGGALWYCGSHYPKGSSFTISFGQDATKGFPVSLAQVNASEIQVKKHSDGSKVRIPLEDLLNGSAMILAQDSQ